MKEKKKKSFIYYLISVIVILAVFLAGAYYVKSLYVKVYGENMRRSEKTVILKDRDISDVTPLFALDSPAYIDLEGNPISAEQYDELKEKFSDCRIIWDVPMSFGRISNHAEAISPSSFSEDDLALLSYFDDLSYINLSSAGINDGVYERVKAAAPGSTVVWETEISGETYPLDIEAITLSGKGLTSTALDNVIDTFELLKTVRITDCEFSVPEQAAVIADHPDISFDWDVELLGGKYRYDVAELAFSSLSAGDMAELKQSAQVLKNVSKIDFGNEVWNIDSISDLRDSFNGAHVICCFDFMNRTIPTTETELDFSGVKYIDISAFDKITHVMPDLRKVIMCDCGFDDETMDALNHKYDGVRFVWTVYVTRYYPLRTDRTYFCGSDRPNAGYIAVSLNDEEIQPLKYCVDMVAMDLGHMHFTNLDFVKDMKQLKYLVVSCGYVHDISMISECESLYYFELYFNQINDISPILACRNLRYLNIGSCSGFDKSPVFEMDFLDYLWYTHNWFSDEELEKLHEALPNTVCYLENEGADAIGGGWKKMDVYYEMRDLMHMFH